MVNKPIALQSNDLVECSKCLNFSLPKDLNSSFILTGEVKYLSFDYQAQLSQVILGEPSSYDYGDFLKASNLNIFKELLQSSFNTPDVVTLIIDANSNQILTLEKKLPENIFANLNIKPILFGGTNGGGGARWP